MFYVYVLRNQLNGRHYTGHTEYLEQRIHQHNHGVTKSTKNRASPVPFQLGCGRLCPRVKLATPRKKCRLWDDLGDESAPVGAYDARRIRNHFIPHPNVAVLVCDSC